MPKITQNETGGQIIWNVDDWVSGLNDYSTTSASYIGNSAADDTFSVNPFTNLGSISAGNLPVAVTNASSVGSVLKNCVVYGDYAYAIETAGKIHKLAVINAAVETTSPFPYTITPSSGSATGEDIIIYKIGTANYAFYSWFSDGINSQGDVGRYNLSQASPVFDDDNFSSLTSATSGSLIIGQRYRIATFVAGDNFTNVGASSNATGVVFTATGTTPTTWTNGSALVKVLQYSLSGALPMPMIVGGDDILYIGCGNKVHALDGQTGSTGTASFDVFVLPTQYIITSFAKLDNQLVIFAYKDQGSSLYRSESKAFFWNYVDQDPDKVVDLDDNYVSCAFNYEGTIGCFTFGKRDLLTRDRQCKIKLYDGSKFVYVFGFHGNPPLNGGIESFSNHIMFNSNGVIYIYGKVRSGLKNSLHKISVKGSTSSMLKALWSNLIVSSSDVTNERLVNLNSSLFIDSAGFYSLSAFPPFPVGKVGRVKMVTVNFMQPTSAGRYLSLSLVNNISGLEQIFTNVSAISETSVLTQKFHQLNSGGMFPSDFNNLAIYISWSSGTSSSYAPQVRDVIVDYEFSDIEST